MPKAIKAITKFSINVIGVIGILNVDPKQAHWILVFFNSADEIPIVWLDIRKNVMRFIGSSHKSA